MWYYRKLSVIIGLFAFTIIGIAASHPAEEPKPPKRNLKVLPKDLSDDDLETIMTRYQRQLGVTCIYCHADTKPDVFPKRVDFASDEKPEKRIAREMIRMTQKINKKYFPANAGYAYNTQNNKQPEVTCKTCHRGFPRPVFY